MLRRSCLIWMALALVACDDAAPLSQGTCSIQGRVAWQGKPVSVTVRALRYASVHELEHWSVRMPGHIEAPVPDRTAPVTVQTNVRGEYRFENLPTGVYSVLARDAVGRVAESAVVLHDDGMHREQMLALSPSRDIVRSMTWADGRAARGTAVLIALRDRGRAGSGRYDPWLNADDLIPDGPEIRQPLDENGTVAFRQVPGGEASYRVEIDLGDGLTHRSDAGAYGSVPRPLEVPNARIESRVVSASGTPIPNAKVHAHFRPLSRTMVTDASGAFSGMIRRPCTLWVVAPDGRNTQAAVEAGAKPATSFQIVVPDGASLEGRVVKADGAPAGGAHVVAIDGTHEFFVGTSASAMSDASGRFAFRALPFQPTHVFVRGGGWVSSDLHNAEFSKQGRFGVDPEEASATRTLLVEPSATLRGRVVDADGKPAAGLQVRALGTTEDRRAIPSALAGPAVVITQADGSFAIQDAVPELVYEVVIRGPGMATFGAGRFPIVAGRAPYEVVLPRPHWLHVRVVDAEYATPIQGAFLAVHTDRRSFGVGEPSGHSGEDGWVRFGPLPPGPYDIQTEHDDYLHAKRVSALGSPVADTPERITIELQRGHSISGTIEGVTVGDADNQLHVHATRIGERRTSGRALADPDGSFILSKLAKGRYRLEVRRGQRGTPTSIEADSGATNVMLALPEAVPLPKGDELNLTVHVSGPDGEPISYCRVALVADRTALSQELRKGVIHFDGASKFRHGSGPLYAAVSDVRDEHRKPLPLGATLYGPFPRDSKNVHIQLKLEQVIEGRVEDETGDPVRRVRVDAQLLHNDRRLGRMVDTASATTDETGHFRLGGLMRGRYRLSVRSTGKFLRAKPIELRSDRTRRAYLVMKRGATVVLYVRDTNGDVVSDAQVRVDAKGVRTKISRSLADGSAWLRALVPEGRYRLQVTPPKNRRDLRPFQSSDWSPSSMAVTLQRGLSIAGIVQDKQGNRVQDARVLIRGENVSTQLVAQNGRFWRDGLPFVPLKIRAWWPGKSTSVWTNVRVPEVSVQESTFDIVFTLPDTAPDDADPQDAKEPK